MLVFVCGPPGAGKTTIATRVHERLRSRGFDVGLLHSDDVGAPTYERLADRVAGTDRDWLLDGTFYKPEHRAAFDGVAADRRVILVTADRDTCVRRNRERDGIPERAVYIVYDEFDPPDADLVIDTEVTPLEAAVRRCERRVAEWLRSD